MSLYFIDSISQYLYNGGLLKMMVNIILHCILFLIFNSHIYYYQQMCLKFFEVVEFHFSWFPF